MLLMAAGRRRWMMAPAFRAAVVSFDGFTNFLNLAGVEGALPDATIYSHKHVKSMNGRKHSLPDDEGYVEKVTY